MLLPEINYTSYTKLLLYQIRNHIHEQLVIWQIRKPIPWFAGERQREKPLRVKSWERVSFAHGREGVNFVDGEEISEFLAPSFVQWRRGERTIATGEERQRHLRSWMVWSGNNLEGRSQIRCAVQIVRYVWGKNCWDIINILNNYYNNII